MANFYKWMTRRKRKDKGLIGDLARDMRGDSSWPIDTDDIMRMHDHLGCMACIEAHEALDAAWAIFTGQENKHWFFSEEDLDGLEEVEIDVTTTVSIRRLLSLKTRFNIIKRDGYRCCICGRDVSDGVKLEVDHRVAVANGGTNDDDNLWTLCFDCNRGKRTNEL